MVRKKKNLSPVSPAETEILRLVWSLDAATVQQVCDALPKKPPANYATVQTLLRRLEKKATSSIGCKAKPTCLWQLLIRKT